MFTLSDFVTVSLGEDSVQGWTTISSGAGASAGAGSCAGASAGASAVAGAGAGAIAGAGAGAGTGATAKVLFSLSNALLMTV